MKESYYERLGVEKTADALQIKRAYYTLVKQYPPERFPEDYKALRAAYDILSDKKKRAEYDQARSLPEDVAYLFDQAEKLERLGRYDQAAEVYRQILRLHSGLTKVQVALARAYEQQRKTGKVITVWEKICAAEPENAEYAYELAMAYADRGWNKKALAKLRDTLELENGNSVYWTSLLNYQLNEGDFEGGRITCEQGLCAMEEHGVESISLYSFAVLFYSQSRETEKAERYLGEIARIMRTGGPNPEPEQTVRFLLGIASQVNKPSYVPYIQEMAATLPQMDDDLREMLADAERAVEIEALEQQGFSALFHDLFATLSNDCDCEDCRLDLLAMECHILAEPDVYRPELLRLQKEFPNLYALHAGFFYEMLHTRNLQKLLHQRLKALSKKGMSPTGFGGEDEFDSASPSEPIRRTEPKVGRNDPCPCGSGKKYKKCCGK